MIFSFFLSTLWFVIIIVNVTLRNRLDIAVVQYSYRRQSRKVGEAE